MAGRAGRTLETAMLHHVDPRPAVDLRDREPDLWPLAVALAVIGPLVLAVGLAVLAPVAS